MRPASETDMKLASVISKARAGGSPWPAPYMKTGIRERLGYWVRFSRAEKWKLNPIYHDFLDFWGKTWDMQKYRGLADDTIP